MRRTVAGGHAAPVEDLVALLRAGQLPRPIHCGRSCGGLGAHGSGAYYPRSLEPTAAQQLSTPNGLDGRHDKNCPPKFTI